MKLKCTDPLSNFTFNFNSCHYITGDPIHIVKNFYCHAVGYFTAIFGARH